MRPVSLFLGLLAAASSAQVPAPVTSVPLEETLLPLFGAANGPCSLESAEAYSNFRILLEYDATPDSEARLFLADHPIALPPGGHQRLEVAFEHFGSRPARLRIWHQGKVAEAGRDLEGTAVSSAYQVIGADESGRIFRFDRDFTAMVRFNTGAGGTLVAKAMPEGKWVPDAKALFIRGGRLVYDIGWLGAMQGSTQVNDGRDHVAVLKLEDGKAFLYVDGALEAQRADFTKPDRPEFVFRTGSAAEDFGGDYEGTLQNVRFWKRALGAEEIRQLSTGREAAVNTPDYNWLPDLSRVPAEETGFGALPGYSIKPRLVAGEGFHLRSARIQPLAASDHGALIGAWNEESRKRGEAIYQQLCVTCHGTPAQPGTLPTALRFHDQPFQNGADPYRVLQTLEKGYGMMVAQPQYSTAQKYEVIHYLREEFLREANPTQYTSVDANYLTLLPRGMTLEEEPAAPAEKIPPYLLQDFGNTLFWTLQVEEGNIAQKGIAIRVDPGPGGISKGSAWMLYDHDTMRLAACWTGDRFIDWRGIAFDGSHGTHTSIVGKRHFTFPNEPMWANPVTGEFEDLRIRGRDGKPYGPLPRDWVHFLGVDPGSAGQVLRYTVGDCEIRERPGRAEDGSGFLRVLDCGPSSTDLTLRLDADRTHSIPAHAETRRIAIRYADGGAEIVGAPPVPAEQATGRQFPGELTTRIVRGSDEGAFAVDVLSPPAPNRNPWQSWMRTSGLDFFPGGHSAAVCTWNGDVWIVDGIDQSEGELRWQRICAGLFQPLGLKIVDGVIHVGCRDMIARLIDLDGDRETDRIENFNNDHQVTEHFHEFAMGLQTDAEGNFYYAKSARHALTAVVPHHGTLLRVSADGSRTDILATGFRAANGVCLNPDGSFIVTDQEGHWNPKNRINWVKGAGVDDFYGNIYGYHDITDESDSAMTPPLCWITNEFDRSPSELLWVPQEAAWKSLRGSLLNFSYGYGKIYVVPHEEVNGQMQGGMCQLPIDDFPTGVMRGRFHPTDGQLYACGMFAWGGNQHQDGGLYRIRATGKPAHLPVGLQARPGSLLVTFTDPLDPASATNPKSWTAEAWDLKRSKNYGSQHLNQRPWKIRQVELSPDGKTVTLTIPDLAPTWGMAVRCEIKEADGKPVKREIHNTIHALGN